MAYKKKTWNEKLQNKKNFPKILPFDPKFPCGRALEKMGAKPGDPVVLAPPKDVLDIMNKVPKGKLITLNDICAKLAKKHNAHYCCTLTTGIFTMTVANATEETKGDTPYWRTIKNNGELNMKYPGGAERQKQLLEKEGYDIIQKGKKYYVKDYEQYLLQTE
jgi:alkylated DNA nucleotide flippase Atl1